VQGDGLTHDNRQQRFIKELRLGGGGGGGGETMFEIDVIEP